MLARKTIVGFLTLVTIATVCHAQGGFTTRGNKPPAEEGPAVVPHPAEDISGMYSFLKEGEFLQINLEKNAVTGYISRMGESDSDHGVFLDQFFATADIQDHAVSFITRPLHGMWYEFKGKFDRGPGKAKTDDGYYVLRGTLKEFSGNADKSANQRSRAVEFKLLAQPEDVDDSAAAKSNSKKQR
jgi:hypothetical protein